ncbi:hypothetical protein [Aquimarina sp. SS2-1]|uniref:hypothetical protein n=1 Tax=Aquimarina besae TaxID=3342247 RepID=UPI003671E07A
MKTLYNNTRITLMIVFFMTAFYSQAQDKLYKTQLETVYLQNTKEIVYKNTFSDYNSSLIALKKINFKKEIKKSKGKNNYLLFVSDKNNIELFKDSYLKIIRKAANRSQSPEAFQIFLNDNLPQLGHQFSLDNNLDKLYFISRKDTFNGRIDALPSVL